MGDELLDVGGSVLVAAVGVVLRKGFDERLASLDGLFEEDVLGEDVEHDVHEGWVILSTQGS